MGKGKRVAKVIERVRARYEIEDVKHGKVYKWQPETVVVECTCGEKMSLTDSETTCKECAAEHIGLVRENVPDLQPQGDEDIHPWRYTNDDEDNGALPY